jgi:hypothetical protein
VAYEIENARFQWDEGERRLREAQGSESRHMETALRDVTDEIRRRLGSSFSIAELASFYGEGTDWADAVAQRRFSGLETSYVVDAAFGRYAREAADFAGGKVQPPPEERERPAYYD